MKCTTQSVKIFLRKQVNFHTSLPRFGFSRASSLLKSGDVSLRFKVKFPACESNSLCLRPLFDNSFASLIGANGGLTLLRERLLPLIDNGGGDCGDEGPQGLGGDLQDKLSWFCTLFRSGSMVQRTAKSLHYSVIAFARTLPVRILQINK